VAVAPVCATYVGAVNGCGGLHIVIEKLIAKHAIVRLWDSLELSGADVAHDCKP